MRCDYLIVGAGLTGATIARFLADAGRDVLVVDRRSHMGGNVHDHAHVSGIRIHSYGPHYFRTSSRRIWDFATRFSDFRRYEPSLVSLVDGRYEKWPVHDEYIARLVGKDWKPEFTGRPSNLEEAALSLMPRPVYEKFIKEYNEKQWGVPATSLSARLCSRFGVRSNGDTRLKASPYQGIPVNGYAAWTRAILAGIPVILNYDYLAHRGDIVPKKTTVFTGPIDEFFGFDLGRLQYRGQQRNHVYVPDADFLQPCGQVNNPLHAGGRHIRTLEWKHMMSPESASRIRGTVLTTETPFTPDNPSDYEYPFPDQRNAELYQRYCERAEALPDVIMAGRLAKFAYFDMDSAIASAMTVAHKLLKSCQNPLL